MKSMTLARIILSLLFGLTLLSCGGTAPSAAPTVPAPPTSIVQVAVLTPTALPATPQPPSPASPSPVPSTPETRLTVSPPTQSAFPSPTRPRPTPIPTRVWSKSTVKLFWPTKLPGAATIRTGLSWAEDRAFFLATTANPPEGFLFAIHGGARSNASLWASDPDVEPLTLRGQPGGYLRRNPTVVFWVEDGQPYAIQGLRNLVQVREIIEGLEVVDLATWRNRLAAVSTPTPNQKPLIYLWPSSLPKDMQIYPNPEVTYADSGVLFRLVGGSDDERRSFSLEGGPNSAASRRPARAGAPLRFRGVDAITYESGVNFALYWEEKGQNYLFSSERLTADEISSILRGLEELDVNMWRSRVVDRR